MSIEEASKLLQLPPQTLRLGLQQSKFPFGEAIKTSPNRFTYYVNDKRLMIYLEGGDLDKGQ